NVFLYLYFLWIFFTTLTTNFVQLTTNPTHEKIKINPSINPYLFIKTFNFKNFIILSGRANIINTKNITIIYVLLDILSNDFMLSNNSLKLNFIYFFLKIFLINFYNHLKFSSNCT